MELQLDFLWRTTQNLPERERIGINRSCPPGRWVRQGRQISTCHRSELLGLLISLNSGDAAEAAE